MLGLQSCLGEYAGESATIWIENDPTLLEKLRAECPSFKIIFESLHMKGPLEEIQEKAK